MEVFVLFFGLLSNDGTVASNSYIVPDCDEAQIQVRAQDELNLISGLGLEGRLVYTCEKFTVPESDITGDVK